MDISDNAEIQIPHEGELIDRKSAVALNLKSYFTGKPCKSGHISKRETGTGQCRACKKEMTSKWRDKESGEKFTNEISAKALPPQEYLKELLDYDQTSGKLYWKWRPIRNSENERTYKAWLTRYVGKEAGSRHYANGYIDIRLGDKKLHKAHRVIWKMMTGEDPILAIDHTNGCGWDNRWENLRLATNQENARNSKTSSATGYKGVVKKRDGWSVYWCVGDINYAEHGFRTPLLAAKHYDSIVKELYGEFARLNFEEENIDDI